jgi:hypothetical protein
MNTKTQVHTDAVTREFTLKGNGHSAQIHFNLPNDQFDGMSEYPGERDLALRAAITEARAFFIKRYAEYKSILDDDAELEATLNVLADSKSYAEFEANLDNAASVAARRAGVTQDEVLNAIGF